ncbi:hypothetical protein [Halanaeroarchaeum sp. HSR-CO]|uniref:hypothetical protein n=1 Tax=Halanaeroarchaeum sp. HSR-CO TaxID=2866382 RepID=UPI00217DE041|nr:hypothetical protein [Halanaeroarchaeum sp. HSR-CO]
MESNGDRIAAIAEAHDLSRDTVRAVVEDLQEGAENPQVCEACGATANAEEDRFVGRVPLADGSEGVRCAECFVELLEGETILSTRQSEAVGYLYLSDLTHQEISRITGMQAVGRNRRRALDKILDARESNSETVPPILEAIEHEV